MPRFQLTRRRLAGSIAAGGLLVAAVATGGSALASSDRTAAQASAGTTSSTIKPTVVLVHGAWANSSSWDGVITRLQHDGYPVVAPPTQLRTLPGDVANLQAYLSTISGPIVLVGHSYGGTVITNAALGNQNVKALVYVDAFAPAKGEKTSMLSGPDTALTPGVFTAVPTSNPAAPDLYVPAAVFATAMANDLPAKTAKLLAATQTPGNLAAIDAASGEPAWKSIPSWYLVGTLDKAIPKAAQLTMATRAKAKIVEVPASHLSMVSQPRAVEDLIEKAARATD